MVYRNASRVEREISDSESTNMTMAKTQTQTQSRVSLQQRGDNSGGRQGPINDSDSMIQQMSISKRKRREYRRQGPVNDSMTSSLQTLRGNRREYRRQSPVNDSMTNEFECLVNNEFCSESKDEKRRWKIISSSMSCNQQRVVIKPVYNPSTFEIEPSLRRYNSEVPISAALRFRFELTLLNDTNGLYIQVKDMIEGRPSGLPLGEGRRRAIIDSTQKKIHKRCKKIAKVMNGNGSSINDIPCEEEDLQRVFHYQFGAKSRGESVMIRPSIRIVSDSDDENNALAIVLIAVVCLFGMLKLYNWESVVA